MTQAITLRNFLTHHAAPDGLDPDLIFLIEDIASACRVIGNRLRNAAFEGNHGLAGETNVQGEDQKKLDVIADETFARICGNSRRLAALVSEEQEDAVWLKQPEAGDYLLFFDPLDGSSNIDVNLSVGSIFSVCTVAAPGERDILKPGHTQRCAGYAIYGPTMMLVLSVGDGVFGFSCEYGTGDFRLTHPGMSIPEKTAEFAINTSRHRLWDQPVRRYVEECLAGETGPRGRDFNMRWTASMVADVHRILIRGGVFLYPADEGNRAAGGKLRLLYEANPMAFLVEQAGGRATVGRTRILDVMPENHHQRVPVILGSAEEVTRLSDYHAASEKPATAP
ncbi:class 1 fructose-bisphosphatase [Lutimaribacter sp. EGI FJ00015]|uniref:Class 1 fructose-bisphosphatase n=1 Tax=Lutimaribacter degradans TaxID=2945989 RepID=A0ACC5ZZR4_9RHOB|nr:class 1 fructose-bisphosphatase [Lutimaribacter sp. EGI FJ00013]MCM2563581.1 class 1 fructose-bisphosphatase [Lutimaribacter sp. EGI FJ00013]MCO0614756.1 class 1 fructose-bisphosphatase [Lutimaribacter sp. EGI FJ00015]MCO0637426.1 class 1 fructose-bisphosphatase [Lutimaribacter sp. EGI FJ00014]